MKKLSSDDMDLIAIGLVFAGHLALCVLSGIVAGIVLIIG